MNQSIEALQEAQRFRQIQASALKAKAIKLHREGLETRLICDRLGAGFSTIRGILRAEGLLGGKK